MDTQTQPAGSQGVSQNSAATTDCATNGQAQADTVALTLADAARYLGKSLRALERSILGKWGNRLPDGWQARKIKTAAGTEWRLSPPPGFKVRGVTNPSGVSKQGDYTFAPPLTGVSPVDRLLPSRQTWHLETSDQSGQAIVIDRADEIEQLLRDLLNTQKELGEERRQRMEDMRLISQMQSSMRLLEDKAFETSKIKEEFQAAQKEMAELKRDYLELLKMPWWKRIFHLNK